MNLRQQLIFLRSASHSLQSDEIRDESLRLIRQGNPYDLLFFSELSDPAWLPILQRNGFFSELPRPTEDPDGAPRYPRHLPLFALKKVAKVAPQQVNELLESL